MLIENIIFLFSLNIFKEYAGNLGDDGDPDWKEQEHTHILSLVDRF